MKSCFKLGIQVPPAGQSLLSHDMVEIDNPDKHHACRLCYLDRLNRLLSAFRKYFPNPCGVRVGDFGCAQGNLSLILSELGYKVYAVDINPAFVEYAKLKYEKGDIEWIVGGMDDEALRNRLSTPLDVAVLGELIEHCAYPEKILSKALSKVRKNGMLILTTPNGSRLMTQMPTFNQYAAKEKRKILEERQFGPDGGDHLFLFKMDEIERILPANVQVIERGYCGGTILVNRHTLPLFRLIPARIVERIVRILSKIPVINSKTYHNLYVILKKTGD